MNLSPPAEMGHLPAAASGRAMAGHINSFLGFMMSAGQQFNVDGAEALGPVAMEQAGTFRTLAQQLVELGKTVDDWPDADDMHAKQKRICQDKLDRAFAAFYVLVKHVSDSTTFGTFKPFFKKAFPDREQRYFAARALLNWERQRDVWQSSAGMQRWAEQAYMGLTLKPGEILPSIGVSIGRVRKMTPAMHVDVLAHLAVNVQEPARGKALDKTYSKLTESRDADRQKDLGQVLNTFGENYLLEKENRKKQLSLVNQIRESLDVSFSEDLKRFLQLKDADRGNLSRNDFLRERSTG